MASQSTAQRIPVGYRYFFLYIDPLFPLFGVYAHLLLPPSFVLGGFSPNPIVPPAHETRLLLDYMAGFYALLFVLQFFGLRLAKYKDDILFWKLIEGSVIFVDVAVVAGFLRVLHLQDRLLDLSLWRGDEWGQIVGNGLFGIVRLCFVLNVGLSRNDYKKQ